MRGDWRAALEYLKRTDVEFRDKIETKTSVSIEGEVSQEEMEKIENLLSQ
nr:MAG TPA: hypothetical protein [Caudoviricetes sp.]